MVMIGQVCREQMRERDEVWALLAQVLMCQRRRVPLAMPLFKPGRVQVGGEPRELRVPRGRKRDNGGIFFGGLRQVAHLILLPLNKLGCVRTKGVRSMLAFYFICTPQGQMTALPASMLRGGNTARWGRTPEE